MQYDLRPVWKALLEVYAPISAILSRNGISYWVACGTTLGAARHKGFIPWDDDFDICVPNHLMDKVKEVLERELPSYLKVVSFENTPEFEEIYLKVQDSRVDIVQNVERESGTSRPHGIYVDIFPLDGIPDSRIAHLWLKIKSISLFCIWNTRFNRFKLICLRRCGVARTPLRPIFASIFPPSTICKKVLRRKYPQNSWDRSRRRAVKKSFARKPSA